MRWLLPLSVALWLAIFGSASSAAQSQSNLTYFGAPRLSLTGVTPTLDITEGYILAQTNTSVSTLSSSAHCSAANPCVDGSCCNSNGLCGYRPEHCRLSSPVTCVANCNATAPCGEFSAGGSTTCPLNLCCSYFGFCGASEPFCNAQVHTQTGLDAPCQGNCGGTQIPSCGKESGTASRRIAYYETWNSRRRDCDKVMPNQLDTTGLTHLVLAFASIDPKTYEVRPLNPADEAIYDQLLALPGSYRRIIGVGGWEFSDPGATRYTWSNMTSKQENRNAFIESFQQFISKWKFTGIDIDWEWPGSSDRGGNAADKENQVAFVAELRKAMGSDFTISVVIPAQYDYLKNMDPTGLEAQVDWLNILAYDLHGAWDANVNGLGPYIKPHTDLKEIDSALELLWSANVTPKNVVMGLANYGRGYIAKNKDCMWYGCKFTGPSRAGECTKQEGVLSTCEIHRIINQHGLKPKIVEGGAGIKEIAWDDQWVGYDDDETFDLKLKLANDRCLGGTALWAIDYATCGGDGGSPSAGNSVAPAPPVATSIKSTASAILPAPSSQIFTTASSATLPPPQLQSSVAFSGAPGTSATHSGDVSIPSGQSSWSTVYSSKVSDVPWSSAAGSNAPAPSNGESSTEASATTSAGGPSSAYPSFWPGSSSNTWAPSGSNGQVPSTTVPWIAPSSATSGATSSYDAGSSGVPIIVPTVSSGSYAFSTLSQPGSGEATFVVPTASSGVGSTTGTSTTFVSVGSSTAAQTSDWGSASQTSAHSSASDSWQGTTVVLVPTVSQPQGGSWSMGSIGSEASTAETTWSQSTAIATVTASWVSQPGSVAPSWTEPPGSALTSGPASSDISFSASGSDTPSSGVIIIIPSPGQSSIVSWSTGTNIATSSGSAISPGVSTEPMPTSSMIATASSGAWWSATRGTSTAAGASGTWSAAPSSTGNDVSSWAPGTSVMLTATTSTAGQGSSAVATSIGTSAQATTSAQGSSTTDGTSGATSGGTIVGTTGSTTTGQGISTAVATSQGTSQGAATTGQASSEQATTSGQGASTSAVASQGTSGGATTATSVQGTSTTAAASQATSMAGTISGGTSVGVITSTSAAFTISGGTSGGVVTTTKDDDSHPTLVPVIVWDSDSHSDSDPECKPNDCVAECVAWRLITFAVFKRPVCPCIPHTCDDKSENKKKKKCKFFGCGCGWMGLPFGPGCPGIDVDLTDLIPPGGLFGENPCRFFGCPGDTPGPIGSDGFCYGPGCDPCPPEICSGHGPSPGPNPTQPTDKPKECEEKDKTRITERFVYCTENFNVSVSAIPSSILGTESTMISTVCIPMVQATLKVCPGAMAGYTTTTTTTLANTVTSSSGAPACTRAPLSLDDDEGSNDDPLSSSIMYSSNTTSIVSSTSLTSSSIQPSSSSLKLSSSTMQPSSSSFKSSSSSVKSSSTSAKPSSSSAQPSTTSKKPTSSPSPAPFNRYGMWKAKISVTMERLISRLDWVLYDPNGDEAGHDGMFFEGTQMTMSIKSSDRTDVERSAPFDVSMTGMDLLDVDKARVKFVIEQTMKGCDFGDGNACRPHMITENRPETEMFEVNSCEFYCKDKKDAKLYQADLWCDDLNDAWWGPKNAGFERIFNCGWKGF